MLLLEGIQLNLLNFDQDMSSNSQIVFLIGAARSGTTLLGEQLLNNLPEFNYIGEKNWVWKFGNVYKGTDELTFDMLSNYQRRYIQERFSYFADKSCKPVLLEKTPSNTLRLPLIMEMFPDAKFIFLFREGAEVARSAAKEWQGISKESLDSKPVRDSSAIKRIFLLLKRESDLNDRKINLQEVIDIPYYFYRFAKNFLKINMKFKNFSWGPVNDSILEFKNRNSVLDTCGYQWKVCTERMIEAIKIMPENRRVILHFNDLEEGPVSSIERILKFLSIDSDTKEIKSLANRVKKRNTISREESSSLLKLVEPVNKLVDELFEQEQKNSQSSI